MDADIPHLGVEVSSSNYRKDFLPVLREIKPTWKEDDLIFKESPKDINHGMLNTMVRCHRNQDPEDAIMIRILNPVMSAFIDRRVEINCIKYLQEKHDCAPKILATFKNGFCYEFIHGEILHVSKLKEEPIWRCLAEQMAKINAANYNEIIGFNYENKLKDMIDKLTPDYPDALKDPVKNERFQKHLADKETMTKEAYEAWNHAVTFECDVVLTHNDTRAENAVWNAKTGVATFVDYEGVGLNHRGAEIAAHFQRFGGFNPTDYSLIPDEEFQLKWIRVYLEKSYQETGRKASDVTDKDVRRLYVQTRKFELVYLMMMALSGPLFDEMKVIPDENIDILGMGIDALKEYYKQKEAIIALTLPE